MTTTPEQAAAHEAGHWTWLAAHGRGDEISSVKIWCTEGGEWTGWTTFDHRVEIDSDTCWPTRFTISSN